MNKEQVTDWKGNIIKEGDEICVIRTRKNCSFKNFGILYPNMDGTFTHHKVPDIPEEDCWEVIECMRVDKGLRVTSKINGGIGVIIYTREVKHILDFMGSNVILAIKGVSDSPDKTVLPNP